MQSDIRLHFQRSRSLYYLLLINLSVFLVTGLLRSIGFLSQSEFTWLATLIRQLSLPSSPAAWLYQPWSALTYMFLHTDFLHVFFNLLLLYWTGTLFTEYLGNDRLLSTYIVGGLVGGLFFILAYQIFPAFSASGTTYLLGASAGVIAVMIGIATLLPDYSVHLLLLGPVKLKYLAIGSVLLYALGIGVGNAGGQIAHLGGALAGFLLVRSLKKGFDPARWWSRRFRFRKASMRVVKSSAPKSNPAEEVDRILDKINRSGFNSLSKEEKEILYRASGKKS